MSWRDRLQPASFRDVEFEVDFDTRAVGRRVETHEYPRRDTPYTEDIGRAARKFQVSAFLIGSDYDQRRDRLLAALEEPGAGTLVHPHYGRLEVLVDGGSSYVTHRDDEGRMCRFSLSFVEAGQVRNPGNAPNTASRLSSAGAAVTSASRLRFEDVYQIAGVPDFVGTLSSDYLGQLGVTVSDTATPSDAFTAIQTKASSLDLPAMSAALGAVPAAPTIVTTPARETVRANALAAAQAFREVGVVRMADIAAASNWPVYDDALEALEAVNAEIDAALAEADDSLLAPLFDLRSRTVEHVRGKLRQATRLRTVSPPGPIPASVLAWRLYGDADRDGEIVDRNGIADAADAQGALLVLEA